MGAPVWRSVPLPFGSSRILGVKRFHPGLRGSLRVGLWSHIWCGHARRVWQSQILDKLSYHNSKTVLFTLHPYYGNLNEVPQQQPRINPCVFTWSSSGLFSSNMGTCLCDDGPKLIHFLDSGWNRRYPSGTRHGLDVQTSKPRP